MELLTSAFRLYCKYCSKRNARFFYEAIAQKDYTVVNEETIKQHLQKNSVSFKDGYTCFSLSKCFCGQTKKNPLGSSEVFINKRTGFFLCKLCKVTADWDVYNHLLAKQTLENDDLECFDKDGIKYDTNAAAWDDIVENTESLEYLTDKACCEVLESFNLTNISRSVIEELSVRVNSARDMLYFPLFQSECVVGYKTYDKNGEGSVFPRINCPGLLKSQKPSNSNAVVVVATVPDFLTLLSLNLSNYDVMCLPYGALYLPQSCLPFFEKYKKIILWLGEKNIDVTGKVAEKLHKQRCFIVKPSKDIMSASTAVSMKENIQSILSKAKLTYHRFVTSFSSFRGGVLAELQNEAQIVGVPWNKFPSLTKILKGHRRGELTILTGPTGVGKTTFLSEYSLDLASQGVYTLWGSFEIKNIRLAKIMLTQYAEAPLPLTIPEFNDLCDKFEQLPIFFLTFHGQQQLMHVMDAIRHCSYIYDIAHVIIDNVQFMIEVVPDSSNLDRFSKQDYMIQMFRSFASQNNCHVTLVMHPKKTEGLDLCINSIFGGVKATQEADNVLIMQKKEGNDLGSTKYLEIAKNRFSGDLGSFPLHFNKTCLSFQEKKSSKISSEEFHEFQGKSKVKNYQYYERGYWK